MTELSVLDLSPLLGAMTGAEAVRETIAMVQIAEKLGFNRFWVAEHHSRCAFVASYLCRGWCGGCLVASCCVRACYLSLCPCCRFASCRCRLPVPLPLVPLVHCRFASCLCGFPLPLPLVPLVPLALASLASPGPIWAYGRIKKKAYKKTSR